MNFSVVEKIKNNKIKIRNTLLFLLLFLVMAPIQYLLAVPFRDYFYMKRHGLDSEDLVTENYRQRLRNTYLPFVKNEGQILDERILYHANIFSGDLYVTRDSLLYSLIKKKSEVDELVTAEESETTEWVEEEKIVMKNREENGIESRIAVEETFQGSFNQAKRFSPTGVGESDTKVSYFKSNDRSKWKSSLSSYNYLNLGYIWDNINVDLKAGMNNVEKIFYVEPDGKPSDIEIFVKGVDDLSIDDDGSLIYIAGEEKFSMTPPIAYQIDDNDGKRVNITVKYRRMDNNTYGFELGDYDKDKMLVIDPLLAGTFFDGTGDEDYISIGIANDDTVYILGTTDSSDIPITLGAYDQTINGSDDFLIARFNNDLTQLLSSTYIGGTNDEQAWYSRISFDPSGNVYISGITKSTDYPVTAGAYDESYNGGTTDGIISKFSADLGSLIASTYIGGSDREYISANVIDSSGDIVSLGYTRSTDFPVVAGGAYETYTASIANSIVFKLDSSLATMTAATFMPGADLTSIALDSSGNIFAAGMSMGNLATTTGAFDTTFNGYYDATVCKFTDDLSEVLAATYLGGNYYEDPAEWGPYQLAIDDSDNIFIAGETQSADFPVTVGAYDTTYDGSKDSFIAKMDNNLSTVLAATYLGSENTEEGQAIALDSSGNVYFTAFTISSSFFETFPTTLGAYQEDEPGEAWGSDTFVSKFNNNLDELLVSTYLGGPESGWEFFSRIALDSNDNVFIVGVTDDPGFPVTSGAYDESISGANDSFFISKLDSDLSTYPTEHLEIVDFNDHVDDDFESGWDSAVWSTNKGTSWTVRDSAYQSDGKLIIVGSFDEYDGATSSRIARLNNDGTLDDTFNSDEGFIADGFYGVVYSVSIQADDKIIVGGSFTSYNGEPCNNIVRLNTDGSLDTSFDFGTGASSYVYSSVVQSDGKIIIGGNFTTYNGTARNRIARLNTDGSLDTSFDPGTGASSYVYNCNMQVDGKIVIGGNFTTYNGTARNRIARLNTDGSLDTSFVPGTGASSYVNTALIQPDGKIIIGGAFTSYNGTARNRIARINTDGSLDTSFNPGTGANSYVYASALQGDGKILIGGTFTTFNSNAQRKLARLNSDGSKDDTFDIGTGFDDTTSSYDIREISIQTDDKIIIGGTFYFYNDILSNSNVIRVNTDGTLDTSFAAENANGAGWRINSIDPHSGTASLYSVGGYGTYSWLEATYDFPTDGEVSFYWKSEIYYDRSLRFCIDKDYKYCGDSYMGPLYYDERITGSVDWVRVVVPVSAGTHTMRWFHDSYQASEDEKAWLDDVKFSSYKAVKDVTVGDVATIHLRAFDTNGTLSRLYNGDKNITFSGLSSVSGVPTCSDKDGFDIPFGTPTTLNFTFGYTECDLKAYTEETASIDMTDSTYDTFASASYDLDVVVSAAVPPVLSATNTSISVSSSTVTAGTSIDITVTSYDDEGDPYTVGGETVIITVAGSNSVVPVVTDNGNGTYSASYTATNTGADLVSATIAGDSVGSDTDGLSDGVYNITVNTALANVPNNLSGVTTESSINLSWEDNSNPAGTEYYAENTTAVTNSGWITDLSWNSNGLTCGNSYTFRVKARNIDLVETAFSSNFAVNTSVCQIDDSDDSDDSGGGGSAAIFSQPPLAPENGDFAVIINNGDDFTDKRKVNLKFNVGQDTVKMALSNKSDFSGASIEDIVEEKEWDLCGSDSFCDLGVKTVYAKFYNSKGFSTNPVSDSIELGNSVITIEINKSNGKTKYREIPINFTGGEEGDTIIVSDNPDFCGANEIPYTDEITYDICNGKKQCDAGKKDVYVKVFNKWGISIGFSSAEIEYEGDTDGLSLLINQGSVNTKKPYVKLDLEVNEDTDTVEFSNYYDFSKSWITTPPVDSVDWDMCYQLDYCVTGEKIIYVKSYDKKGEVIGNSSRSIHFENTEDGLEVVIEKGVKNVKTERVLIGISALPQVESVKISDTPDFCGAEEIDINSGDGETEIEWDLCPDEDNCESGDKEVYVEFYDEDGNLIGESSDDVYYEPSDLGLVINDGDIETDDNQVELEIIYNDEVDKIVISNPDNSESEATLDTDDLTGTKDSDNTVVVIDWDLCANDANCESGDKEVVIEFFDENGDLIGESSDVIYYEKPDLDVTINDNDTETSDDLVELEIVYGDEVDTIVVSNFGNAEDEVTLDAEDLVGITDGDSIVGVIDWDLCVDNLNCETGNKEVVVEFYDEDGNILDTRSDNIYYEDPADVQDFVINEGDFYTNDSDVVLNLTYTDEVESVVISQNPDMSNSIIISVDEIRNQEVNNGVIDAQVDWNICQGESVCNIGEKEVFVEFLDEDGKVIGDILSDDIFYNGETDDFELSINNGEDITSDTAVTLDIDPSEDTEKVFISNEDDFSDGVMIDVVDEYSWDICYYENSCFSGEKNIYTEYYDSDNNVIGHSNDSIYYLSEGFAEVSEKILPAECKGMMDQIITEADQTINMPVDDFVAEVGRKRNSETETYIKEKYLSILTNGGAEPDNADRIIYFIAYGTKSTIRHGEGERTGVINSYKSAFNKLPKSAEEWIDVIRIANGCTPIAVSPESESIAAARFFDAYGRNADLTVENDQGAIDVISYGLRPSVRDLERERVGIKLFRAIFNKIPGLARAWDIVRSFAYSGAVK